MSDDPRDILAAIDAAVTDWEVSPDAMRARPQGFPEQEGRDLSASISLAWPVGSSLASVLAEVMNA